MEELMHKTLTQLRTTTFDHKCCGSKSGFFYACCCSNL